MRNIARHYSCPYCHKEVTICRACDRGHVYCGPSCSEAARFVSLKKSGRKYQSNQQGKLKHAERQKRYRMRHKKIVTHHSSKSLPTHDLLPPILDTPRGEIEKNDRLGDRCHFCGTTIKKRVCDGTDS